ncbi:uncharacterized protein LOC135210460 [Macrobrachium nipponense]|uniref:uncharacterized protein LOC135210460 n=1 Tax=Macrobrachium nipponense TaxID=159736 RepID=UPI0030C8AA8F
MRWTNERLTWNDILEIVEDYQLDRCMKESKSVSVRTEVAEGIPEFKSYREAVLEGPRQMAECGQVRHIASRCRGTRVNVICGNCGKNGHYARMCKEPYAKCAECGLEGHVCLMCVCCFVNCNMQTHEFNELASKPPSPSVCLRVGGKRCSNWRSSVDVDPHVLCTSCKGHDCNPELTCNECIS